MPVMVITALESRSMAEGGGFRISGIRAREILDSRGNPTLEVEVWTDGGFRGVAAVPSGASTGSYEALELRDGDRTRFMGRGVLKAVGNVNHVIQPRLLGIDVREQREIDGAMLALDSTSNKSKLGANAILGVSLATAKAAASGRGQPLYRYLGGEESRRLPIPMMNLINGGRHAGNELAIQEFMVVPSGAGSFAHALRMGVETYHALRQILRSKYGPSAVNVGDEGGYAPPMRSTFQALDALVEAIGAAGYVAGKELSLGIDSAASSFYVQERGLYRMDDVELNRDGMIAFYEQIVERYPVVLLEDPLWEEDFDGFAALTRRVGDRALVVGDDLFVTNVERLRRGIGLGAANALLLKVNQIGTLSEAMEAAGTAFASKYEVVVSHRSGETLDTTISDLSVGLGARYIKAGAPARGERVAKYNRLLGIEEELGAKGRYAGKTG